ncbi:hypothetical protein [Acidithiobacillus sp.]
MALIMVLSLFLAVICGDYGPWYFAWLVGTTMIVLIAAAGAVMFDKQEEEQQAQMGCQHATIVETVMFVDNREEERQR